MGLKNADMTLSSKSEKLQFLALDPDQHLDLQKKMWIQIQGLKNVDLGGSRSDPTTLLLSIVLAVL